MKYLENKLCYLSGPIQYATGENWREYPNKILSEEFGIKVFDPSKDPKQQWVPALKEAQANKDYKTMARISKSFVRKDLGILDRSDFLIAYLPVNVATVCTCHEIINSNNSKKPTLLVTNADDITKIPLWYFGFISLDFMFAGWESLFTYLREVNTGKHKNNDRWAFVYDLV